MNTPRVGDTLAYFAEPNSKDEPYSGPYPAKVVKVYPAKEAVDGRDAKNRKPAEPLKVDLVVKFSDGPIEHTKSSVRVTGSPEKHCCTTSPYKYDFESWFKELEAIETKRLTDEAAARAKAEVEPDFSGFEIDEDEVGDASEVLGKG